MSFKRLLCFIGRHFMTTVKDESTMIGGYQFILICERCGKEECWRI